MTQHKINNQYLQKYDVAGIGIGAFNLGLAALISRIDNLSYIFFDKKSNFSWHSGMLLDNSKLQVHYLKDLASCIDPCNPYTFLSYLVDNDRIYQFLNCKKNSVSRHEFNDYYKWASLKIPGLHFNEEVKNIYFEKNNFIIITENSIVKAKDIVLGIGPEVYIPECCQGFLAPNFFHTSEFNTYYNNLDLQGRSVVIIGGGQSGAEALDSVISSKHKPKSITWVSSRSNFHSLEDSCFSNEFYTPHYVNYFYKLSDKCRKIKLEEQKLTSDGITQALADEIYNKLYEIKYINNSTNFELISNHQLTKITKPNGQYKISVYDKDNQDNIDYLADVVILATGYRPAFPSFLKNLLLNVKDINELKINLDYSIHWKYEKSNKIYIQNGAKQTHGIADPNLSLATWRNAIIINSILGKNIYKTYFNDCIMGRTTSQAQN